MTTQLTSVRGFASRFVQMGFYLSTSVNLGVTHPIFRKSSCFSSLPVNANNVDSKEDFIVDQEEWTSLDTLRSKDAEILGSTSPLKLDTLRYPTQRWFSLLRVTFRAPHVSCISTKFA
ncbi:MAG: hypothetical protein ACK51W_20610 [Aphanizomenon sp.]